MAKNEVVTVKLTKEPVLSLSKATEKNPQGLEYLKLNLVEDTVDGAKWYDGVAFGSMAKNLSGLLKKGMEFKAIGPITLKEYTKKDGGVGTSNNLVVNKVILEGGVEVDKFTKPPEPAPF